MSPSPPWLADDGTGSGTVGSGVAAPASRPQLNQEQLLAAHAPLEEALAVLAAAGTGKTTTMLERVCHALRQGVEPEACLVLTFSRKACSEFQERLRSAPNTGRVTVSTFHAWAWIVLRRHWREAGFQKQPTLMSAEGQQLALLRDCLVWDRLAELQACMRGWLFLPPASSWAEVAEAAAERHAGTYTSSLRAVLHAHNEAEQPSGSWVAHLTLADAVARPFLALPPRLQMLLLLELHTALQRRFDSGAASNSAIDEEAGAHALLSAASAQAPCVLSWLESEKRRGRMPDAQAYAAHCASAGAGAGAEAHNRQTHLLRASAAYQAELQRLSLVTLSDLPLLARQVLAGRGEALSWARAKWTHVLVDEFQDTGRCMLDLLKLLMGERRSITVVGDPDQSIYSFLSALPAIFCEFRDDFTARVACLETNFRSTAAICAFGTAVLHGNRGQAAEKRMLPARAGPCRPVTVRQFGSAEEEAGWLAEEVHRLWSQEGVPHSSVAVLYRCLRLQGTAPHAPLVAALRRRGIAYEVVGQDRLAEDEGVAALISYLALVANPGCDPAFEAVLRQPWHGLGQDVCSAISQQRQTARLAGLQPPSLLECAERMCGQAPGAGAADGQAPGGSQLADLMSQLNNEDVQELERLVQLLKQMQQAVGREPLPQAVHRVLHESGLVAWLRQQQEAAATADEWEGGQQQGREEELPPRLQAVLHKAQQLAAEWESRGQSKQPVAGMRGNAGAGGAAAAGWLSAEEAEVDAEQPQQAQQAQEQQQAGVELVKELLLRLATETTSDGAAGSTAGTQQARQHQRHQQQAQQQGQQQWQGFAEPSADPGALTISTIHAAKGLEWNLVLLPHVCDGHMPVQFRPSAAALAGNEGGRGEPPDFQTLQHEHYAEERRLFHVACTRARDRLLICYVQPAPAAPMLEEDDLSQQQWQQQQQRQSLAAAEDLSQLPHCSSILAAMLRRWRRAQTQQAQQGQHEQHEQMLRFEGRLPEEDFPGLWQPLAVDAPPARPRSDGHGSAQAGGTQGGGSQLTLAEKCRQRLAAAKAGGGGGLKLRGGVGKRGGGGRGEKVAQ